MQSVFVGTPDIHMQRGVAAKLHMFHLQEQDMHAAPKQPVVHPDGHEAELLSIKGFG